ncbi:hypothetical protein CEP52_005591 [Fusarium oligoseptatum]|uniref:Major facilitator superfamily (MFS) profile domain-containing protein n=1 Tax=Fusarium oligoseptatum TaxID=2604345 RepID=A0A428TXK3_9HYPO|nr:hypothetical protein CEP52_005591 [Fusarium oligoseptatum]
MAGDMNNKPTTDMIETTDPRDDTVEKGLDEGVINPTEDKRLVRRIDFHVLPWICITYALSLIDRTNIAAAKIVGMEADLNLTGNQFNVALLIFFITYLVTEIPSNIVIKAVGTQSYLMTYGQLLALRVLLGFFEGGFNPACIYLISCWYKRYEVQQRLAIWFVFGSVVSGFTGVISYGLSLMEGQGGLRGWGWIFIIPGAITVAVAIPIFFFVAEFLEKAKWLTAEEQVMIQRRLAGDQGEDVEGKGTMKSFLEAAIDWKVYVISMMLMLPTATTYALSSFSPSILASFGFSVTLSQVLTTPPYIFGAIVSILTGIMADRVRLRSPFITGYSILHMAGLAMISWGGSQGARYTSMFLAVAGSNCAIPSALAFLARNVVGTHKRQFAVPIQSIFGGIGGIIGSLMFREANYPGYRPGIYASFGCMAANTALASGLAFYFWIRNRQADRTGKVLEGVPGFRYTT